MARGRKPRNWVRLDCQGVLHGSINYIYNLEEQAVFIKMIAMAEVYGQEPGLISDSDGRALPKEYVAHELHCSQEILNSVIDKGSEDKAIEENGSGIRLLNFGHYQFTEYDRQKPYRQNKQIANKDEYFNRFWKAYPKKVSKGQAEKAFFKLNPDEKLLAIILDAIERAKESENWQKEGGKFIQNPATWLNAKGWEDEYLEKKQPEQEDNKPIPGLKIR